MEKCHLEKFMRRVLCVSLKFFFALVYNPEGCQKILNKVLWLTIKYSKIRRYKDLKKAPMQKAKKAMSFSISELLKIYNLYFCA